VNEPLDELYLTWLYSQVGSVKLRTASRTHWSLIRQLYTKEFVWLVPNDDNRVEDGRDLRQEFLDDRGIENTDPDWMGLGCSMLEMLIALSRRFSFEAEGEPREWFWHMLENLELPPFNDREYNEFFQREINDSLERVIWRTYSPNGFGGLFPLQHPKEDQRDVELWYQLSTYLLEELWPRGG
jgi:hypothetical protein